MKIGEKIKKLRKERGMTQEELGNLLGVKKSAVQKYENGVIQNLKLDTIRKLCAIFSIYPWEIVYSEKIADSDQDEKTAWLKQEESTIRFIGTAYGSKAVEILETFVDLDDEKQQQVLEYANALFVIHQKEQDIR